MTSLKDLLQSADWKQEKHVPVIDSPDTIKKGQNLEISVIVGKEIGHPNTSEHHIAWMEIYFLPEGEKFLYLVGRFDFSSHGASAQGPNTSSIYTDPQVKVILKTEKSGTIFATSYCNIHGLWESSKLIKVG